MATQEILIFVSSKDHTLRQLLQDVLQQLPGNPPAIRTPPDTLSTLRDPLLKQLGRLLKRLHPGVPIRMVPCVDAQVPSEESLHGALLGLVVIDGRGTGVDLTGLEQQAEHLLHQLEHVCAGAGDIPQSVVVLGDVSLLRQTHLQACKYPLRVVQDCMEAVVLDLVRAMGDLLHIRAANPHARRTVRPDRQNVVGQHLLRAMKQRFDQNWCFYYYTGSAISNLISFVEQHAQKENIPVLRGSNEHALACGALANWLLYQKGFVIVVTSGMLDELKGTLANLQEAGAPGFIVTAESLPGQWLPFQGTISHVQDIRQVLRARNLPFQYIDDPLQLPAQMASCLEAFARQAGPQVLLLTPPVLEHEGVCEPHGLTLSPHTPAFDQQAAEQLVALINHERTHVVWQCGQLTGTQRGRILNIARQAGIALVDSPTLPGNVPAWHQGQPVKEYIGTLGIYSYSHQVQKYFGSRSGNENQVVLFFINSTIPQADIPFSPANMQNRMRTAQVMPDRTYLAPFITYPCHSDLDAFLTHVETHLKVDPAVLEFRRHKMRSTAGADPDITAHLDVYPMNVNRFTTQFNGLMQDLITRGYRYTGVYDSGRGGLSAARNIIKTQPGFSGGYGRAAMGDALQAISSLAVTSHDPIVAFIGDGARGIVPDILPHLLENLLAHQKRSTSINLFYLVDGGLSIVKTYQHSKFAQSGGRQMRCLWLQEDHWTREVAGIRIHHHNLEHFDEGLITQALQGQDINLFTVKIGHNDRGDSIGLFASGDWLNLENEEVEV